METVFKLKASELDLSFIKMLKKMLGKNDNIEISINIDKKISQTLKPETKEKMKERIDTAIEETESGKNLIVFSGNEFDKYMISAAKK